VSQHFSGRLPWPTSDNTLARLKAGRAARGLPILDFSASNPTRVGLASSSESEASSLLAPWLDSANLRYTPDPRGLLRPREALSRFYADRAGGVVDGGAREDRCGLDPADFFLCASTSEAYGLLFKLLCDAGDAVLVPKPGYPLFDYLAGLEAVEARPYRMEYFHPAGWRIDLDSVETALKAGNAAGAGSGKVKALVLINPNNPTGSYVRRKEREALVELCAAHGVALICDEVFYPFALEADETGSFLGEDRVLTFVLDGLSKLAGLPQAKLGWIAISGPAGEKAEASSRLEIIADTYLSAGTPVMNALSALLEASAQYRAELIPRLRSNLATLRSTLGGSDSPHRVLRCDGGWTALIESPRLEGEEELAALLLTERGIYSQPGYFFDMEKEAYFTASLILQPETFAEGARGYRAFFEARMS
jgi:aspartate/methionine/tyrosine aminotransferase